MKAFLKFFFILVGIVCTIFIVYQQSIMLRTPGEIFAKKFESDIDYLFQNNYLPKFWTELKEVNFVSTSKGSEQWLLEAKPKIHTEPNGKYSLEYVLIDDSEPDKQLTIALVQMSVIEIASGNKIWELARVYSLDDEDEENDKP
jgi:hypothetical protein